MGDDAGTDTFHITLKNDWVLENFEFDVDKSGDDGDYVKAPIPAFPRGATKWSPSVKWLASADDEVTYEGQIMISGPKGVPTSSVTPSDAIARARPREMGQGLDATC